MTEAYYKQRIERFVREGNIPGLLDEVRTLIFTYIGGDDDIDLEPLVSAQWVLQQVSELHSSQNKQEYEFPVTSVSRSDLEELGPTPEQLAALSYKNMERIARLMENEYVEYGSFWSDLRLAANTVLKDLQLPELPKENGA